MRNRTLLCYFGAVLLIGAAPVVSGAKTPSAQTTSTVKKKKKKTVSSNTPSSRTVSSKRAASSKSRRKPKTSAQKAPTPDRIREIQSALQREGAFQGEPTGKWDDSTVQAMKNYQDKNGLSPSGKIDALTLQKLGLGSDTAGKGAPVPATPATAPAASAPHSLE